jgi:16S rRNA processing protein RimM
VFVECNKHLVLLLKRARFTKMIFLRIREDVGTEEAEAILGNDLYLPIKMLPKLTGNKFYFHEVMV